MTDGMYSIAFGFRRDHGVMASFRSANPINKDREKTKPFGGSVYSCSSLGPLSREVFNNRRARTLSDSERDKYTSSISYISTRAL